MSSDMKPVWLTARSALGTTAGVPARDVFRSAGLRIVEEGLLPIHSLRRSRVAHDEAWLSQTLRSVGLELPEVPRAQSGDATLACVRIEPHAWLITGQIDVPSCARGWLHTELTSRFCAFRLEGVLAHDVLSAGANVHGVLPGMGCRMSFAESAAVVIQCFAAAEYRLMVDVGLAPFIATWLSDAGHNRLPVEERVSDK